MALDHSAWPIPQPTYSEGSYVERRSTVLVHTVHMQESALSFCSRFSSWTRLLRVLATTLRWLPRHRGQRSHSQKPLSSPEISHAKFALIKLLQAEQFAEELDNLHAHQKVSKTSTIASLDPFVDSQGLLRVGGRLHHASVTDLTRHPLLLKAHHITRLIIIAAHQKCLHGGLTLTLSTLRSEFWVVQAKRSIRSVVFHCVTCARLKAAMATQLIGSLPSPRILRRERPFSHCAVDYAGPIAIRESGGRGRKSHPAYIALFVCIATKTIHVEVVSSYSSEAFLATYHRFCSRRGIASHMYSDRGTTFQGASRELSQAYARSLTNPEFQALLSRDNTTWHFIPPAAPHFGGLWEAGVKSVKHHLKRILLARTPTFEELTTLTARIEACLNSRPVAPLTEGLDSLDVLTPAHFLIGTPITAIPAPTLLDTAVTRLSRWQAISQLTESFWQRWTHDYVNSLQTRSKWKFRNQPVRVGQIVLLRSDMLPSTKWNLARVTEVHPGSDGLVRVVALRTATTTLKRPISKLALLPDHLADDRSS